MTTDTGTLAEQSVKPSDAEQKVLDALITLHRHGVDLACGYEVAEKLTAIQSRPVQLGWVTARLDELKKKGVVDTAAEKRLNPWTGRLCQQWYIPAQQARLCA